MRHFYLYLFLLAFSTLNAKIENKAAFSKNPEQTYPKNPYVAQDVWDAISVYFLPADHPAKIGLDEIFKSNERIILNSKSIKKAGFDHTKKGKYSQMVAATHPKVPGFYLKFYTDDVLHIDDAMKLLIRARGAESVKNWIQENGYDDLFKVPKKWIYPLPLKPGPKEGMRRKNFLLLSEDMELASQTSNLAKWKSDLFPKKTVEAVFFLLKSQGLRDSLYPFNLPFAKDGRIAVVDTEYNHEWPVRYHVLGKYFSKPNRILWDQLITENE